MDFEKLKEMIKAEIIEEQIEERLNQYNNGTVLKNLNTGTCYVLQESDNEEEHSKRLAEMLCEIKDELGSFADSKFSKSRVYILTAPGEDSPEGEERCPFCFREYDEVEY